MIISRNSKCSEGFEANQLKPAVVFTNVQDPETALQLWDEAAVDGNALVMVTSKNELVIYELVSDIHESITGEVIELVYNSQEGQFG